MIRLKLTICIIFSTSVIFAQNTIFSDEEIYQIVNNYIGSLEGKLDSAAHAMENQRAQIKTLIGELGYDPKSIVGDSAKYIQLGGSKLWDSDPHYLLNEVPRRPGQYRLEAAVVDLYFSDKWYLKNKNILSKLHGIMEDSGLRSAELSRLKWDVNEWSDLLDSNSIKSNERFVEHSIKRNLLYDNSTNWEYKCDRSAIRDIHFTSSYVDFVRTELINNKTVSYPFDGQFNFYIDGFKRYCGYMIYKVGEKEYRNMEFKYGVAVWTHSSGESFSCLLKTRSHKNFDLVTYPIPYHWLKPGQIYSLEFYESKLEQIIQNESMPKPLVHTMPLLISGNPDKFELIGQIFFRTSMYPSFFDKILDTQPEWGGKDVVHIPLDEPLEQSEVNTALPYRNAVWNYTYDLHFTFNHLLREGDAQRYLSVPEMYEVDTINFKEKSIYDLDHTIDAKFIREVGRSRDRMKERVYDIKAGDRSIIADTLDGSMKVSVIGNIPKSITEEDFKNGQVSYTPMTLKLHNSLMEQLRRDYAVLQMELRDRRKERARLFYNIYVVLQKRKGLPIERDYDYFFQKESEYWTEVVQRAIENDIEALLHKEHTFHPQGGIPGAALKSLYGHPTFKLPVQEKE